MRSCKTKLLKKRIIVAVIFQKIPGGKLMGTSQKKDRWNVLRGRPWIKYPRSLLMDTDFCVRFSDRSVLYRRMHGLNTNFSFSRPSLSGQSSAQSRRCFTCMLLGLECSRPLCGVLSMDNMTGIQSVKRLEYAEQGLACQISY